MNIRSGFCATIVRVVHGSTETNGGNYKIFEPNPQIAGTIESERSQLSYFNFVISFIFLYIWARMLPIERIRTVFF